MRRRRVHLLGYNSPPQTTPATGRPYVLPGLIEDAPLYRVWIELDRSLKRAQAFNRSTAIRPHWNCVEATVNNIHEVILLRY